MLSLPEPGEVRRRIDAIPDGEIRIPRPSRLWPDGEWVVLGKTLRGLDRMALLGGFRISELVAKPTRGSGNTSDTLEVTTDTHHATGEEALIIRVYALKKQAPVQREIGIPLNPRYEPWAEKVLRDWEDSGGVNPYQVDRVHAWAANRLVFDGIGYKVAPQRATQTPEHLKPGGNHILRHERAAELRRAQLSVEERVAYFAWSAQTAGLNSMLATYDRIPWFDIFPKLLRPVKEAARVG